MILIAKTHSYEKIKPSLESLNSWIEGIDSEKIHETPLVIDDESDYASVNTSPDATANRVNEEVRTFLDVFRSVRMLASQQHRLLMFLHRFTTMIPSGLLFSLEILSSLPEPENYTGFSELFPTDEENSPHPFSRVCCP